MGLVCRYFQIFLYYPSSFFALYLYVVIVIPLRSRLFRNDYWFFIGTYLRRSNVGNIFGDAIKRWKGGGTNGN
uniref:hypothetical protein Ycf94 n=1 Tax=Adiantum malesianum TaxID=451080 RepID=UPI00201D5274|nr:hypothetical protein Ycf94 [Adiantum malesianum]UPV69500.1 hypothetical protein Ycf94 [Adiantum malesianum]